MNKLNREKFHVRQVEQCCGTCKHFARYWEDAFCEHPELYDNEFVDEGFVCDLWEKEGSEK